MSDSDLATLMKRRLTAKEINLMTAIFDVMREELDENGQDIKQMLDNLLYNVQAMIKSVGLK